MERFHYTQMTKSKHLSTLQNQHRSAKRLPRIVEDIQLRLVRQASIRVPRCGVLCDVLDRVGNLSNIVFNQELCPSVRTIVQLRRRYVSEIADKTAAKDVYQAEDIVVLLGFVDGSETLVDEAMVVVFAYSRLPPATPK